MRFHRGILGALAAFVVLSANSFAQAQGQCEMKSRGGRHSMLILYDRDLRYDDSYGVDEGGRRFSVGYALCDGRYVRIEKQRPVGDGDMLIVVEGRYRECRIDRSRNWQTTSFSCYSRGRDDDDRGRDRRVNVSMRAMRQAAANENPYNMGWDQWNWFMNERVVGHTHLTNSSLLAPETYGLRRRHDGRIMGFERGMSLETWCDYLRNVISCY